MGKSENQKTGQEQNQEKTQIPVELKRRTPEQQKAYLRAKREDLTEVATALEKKYQRVLGQIELLDELINKDDKEIVIEK